MINIHPPQVWTKLGRDLEDDIKIDGTLLGHALDRADKLEQLLRIINTYEEAVKEGRAVGIIRGAIFTLAKELR